MSLGPVVDVGIGLIFIYLLLGLIASAVQELVAGTFAWRSNTLESAIRKMLDSDKGLFEGVYGHPLIKTITEDDKPSYIPSPKFCLAVMDTLLKGNDSQTFADVDKAIAALHDGWAKESLRALANNAAGDLTALKQSIENWYDDAMDRLAGAYKRLTQKFVIIFGLLVAIILNVDTLRIAETLWTNDAIRSNLVAVAQARVADNQPATPNADSQSAAQDLGKDAAVLDALKLPIGWDVNGIISQLDKSAPKKLPDPAKTWQPIYFAEIVGWYFWTLGPGGSLLVLLGWAITGIAVSFGAPFWFDLLKNFVNLRSAGNTPPRADKKKKRN